MKHFSLIFWGYFLAISAFSQSIVYVTPTGAGDHSGNAWGNALSGVQLPNRVATADSGTQFWIAAGTYKPTTTTDRTASFIVTKGIRLYGGFSGKESSLLERNYTQNETIISGDIGIANYIEDNSYTLFLILRAGNEASVDGFTVKDGYQTESIYYNNLNIGYDGGSGMVIYSDGYLNCSPSITNCRFVNNCAKQSPKYWGIRGGAILVIAKNNGLCFPVISSCYFNNNKADEGGGISVEAHTTGLVSTTITNSKFEGNLATNAGALACLTPITPETGYSEQLGSASVVISKCVFTGNQGRFGGAITSTVNLSINQSVFTNNLAYSHGGCIESSGNTAINNCVFVNNQSSEGGSLAYSDRGQLSFINCTLYSNATKPNRDLNSLLEGGEFQIKNSIITGEPASYTLISKLWYSTLDPILSTSYSLIQNGYPGIGNLNSDPLFIDPANGNFRLQPTSPAINAGSPDITDLLPTDIAGNPRIQGNRVDMGAYEFIGCSICLPFIISRIR
ncbi:choice-of-anchor Q domain-containing protein [Spirosoma aerolatum]|uniref:choice-of-anchor Q domain-containing protein n=1 Tax=Spirosoma aerolatum TaxID=1211326 RepID=UPI0009AC5768|nr:choice-of-anchor Q domain-containing protein [Spirosoma aerolatum]